MGAGRCLTFHSDMASLLNKLKSEIPPIPNDLIFEFVYGKSGDVIQELESNSTLPTNVNRHDKADAADHRGTRCH